jgi:hypothetical protein
VGFWFENMPSGNPYVHTHFIKANTFILYPFSI